MMSDGYFDKYRINGEAGGAQMLADDRLQLPALFTIADLKRTTDIA